MEINTRSRSNLKSYFVKNAIPTESNFAELIDGTLNQKDDGIVKLTGDPLSIEATGGEDSQKKAINFYRNFTDSKPEWVLSLNPRSNPSDPKTARSGFSISDGDGNSRLFIDRARGNVGIGTTAPRAKLHIVNENQDGNGNTLILGPENQANLRMGYHSSYSWIQSHGNRPLALNPVGNNVGIGTTTPEDLLEVHGRASLGIGIANSHFPWRGNGWAYISGKGIIFREDAAGGYQERMRIADNGHVGIGTTTPEDLLEVHGRASLGIGIANSHFPWRGNGWAYISGKGIIFREDAAGGYQERMRIADNGHVGIGTTSPDKPLHIKSSVANPLVIEYAHANTADATGLIDRLPNRTLVIGGIWRDSIYFYWKDDTGQKYMLSIKGTPMN